MSREYMLHINNQTGTAETVKIKLGDTPAFYFAPRWSPDSKKIAYMDSYQSLWYVDVNDKRPIKVDKDPFWGRP